MEGAEWKAVSYGSEVDYLLLNAYGQSDGSPLRTALGFRAGYGRPWQGGTYAAISRARRQASVSGLCVKCLILVRGSVRVRSGAGDTTPATTRGARDTARARALQLGSGPQRPHREGCWDAVERARYRSHSSFVDGRDNYLDVVPRQGRAPSLTERLQGLLSTAACRHKRGSKGIEVRRKPRSSLAPSGARVDEWRNPTDSSAPSRACTIARS